MVHKSSALASGGGGGGGGVSSFNTRTGAVTLTGLDVTNALGDADLAYTDVGNVFTSTNTFSNGILFGTLSSSPYLSAASPVHSLPTVQIFDEALTHRGIFSADWFYDGTQGLAWGGDGAGNWAAFDSTFASYVPVNALAYYFSSSASIVLNTGNVFNLYPDVTKNSLNISTISNAFSHYDILLENQYGKIIIPTQNASYNSLSLRGISSQTAPLQLFEQISSTSTARTTGIIDAPFISSTDATYTGRLTLSANDYNGAREGIRIDATGSAAALGFFGTTAVTQQTGNAVTALGASGYGLITSATWPTSSLLGTIHLNSQVSQILPPANGGTGFTGPTRVTALVTNATATMANLTDLTSGTVNSGSSYVGTLVVFANNSVKTEGLQFDFGGSSATFTSIEFGFGGAPAVGTVGTSTSISATTAITITTTASGTADECYIIPFAFVVSSSGTVIPRFAEATSVTGLATVEKNSYLMISQSTN